MYEQIIAVNVNILGGCMKHDKIVEFAKIGAMITASIETLLKAQSELIELFSKECNLSPGMKEALIMDMNKVIGVKSHDK